MAIPFDVTLESHDSRISEDIIRIRLADIDTPEVRGPKACETGKKASAYSEKDTTIILYLVNRLQFKYRCKISF